MPFEGARRQIPEGKKKSQPQLPTLLQTREKGRHIYLYLKERAVEDIHHTYGVCFPHINTDDVLYICTVIEIPVFPLQYFGSGLF